MCAGWTGETRVNAMTLILRRRDRLETDLVHLRSPLRAEWLLGGILGSCL